VPKGAASTADVLKDSAPALKDAQPVLAVNIEEGEILVGETLMALRGGEAHRGSSVPPSDKEVEGLEGMPFDESGKVHLLGFSRFAGSFAASEGVFAYVILCSCISADAAALGRDPWAWRDWDSPSRERSGVLLFFVS
jgi:hypothetical protein